MIRNYLLLIIVILLSGCSEQASSIFSQNIDGSAANFEDDTHGTYNSTYIPLSPENIIIKNAIIFDGNGNKLENTEIHFSDGLIQAIGQELVAEGAEVLDASGKYITPGIIDIHSHMGVYPAPSVRTSSDGNEATNPVTAEVWAEHSVWSQDPQYKLALAGGVTTFHVLPGSANLFGGRGVTLKNVSSNTVPDMKFPNAPHSLKMACGENPKRVYSSRGPSTRMGNVADTDKLGLKQRISKIPWRAHLVEET